MLDSYRHYDEDQTLLFEPRKTELMQPLVSARVVVNYILTVILIIVSNISAERVTITTGKELADDIALKARRVDFQQLSTPNCVALVSTTVAGFAPSADHVAKAIKNADISRVTEHQVLFERLLCKHDSAVFPASQTSGAPA